MITVTRLNGSSIVVNDDLIVTIENTPDTILTMTTGEKLTVQEPVEDIVKRVITFRRRLAFRDVAKE